MELHALTHQLLLVTRFLEKREGRRGEGELVPLSFKVAALS